ncbi:MAG TPA: hypothetical protein VHB46_16145 [Burkholderiales bacterium]|nr:hypothetical protein [Burkholderiales bacterium]
MNLSRLFPEKWFSGYQGAMSVFGTLTTIASVISLVQHWGDIRLAAIPAAYLEYYRALLQGILGWISLPLGFRLPQWYLDLLAVNGVMAGAAVRAIKGSGFPQAKAFTRVLYASIPLLLSWLAAPFLIIWVHWFSRTSISDAERSNAEWRATIAADARVATAAVEKEMQENDGIVRRYREFIVVEKLFLAALFLVAIATFVFFVLNGLVKQ